MSDGLTRYDACVGPHYADDWEASPEGMWVKAEEAEARIKELEAEIARQKNAAILELDNAREFAKRQVYEKYGTRLRAADELADAVAPLCQSRLYGVGLNRALTAYREASK